MPRLDDDNFLNTGTAFAFSHTGLKRLGADAYTLVNLMIDISGSVSSFETLLLSATKAAIEGLKKSPRADNLLIRVTTIGSSVTEVHGYRLLNDIVLSDYDSYIRAGGTTPLYDGMINNVNASETFAETLAGAPNYFTVNVIDIDITDGCDYGSVFKLNDVKNAYEKRKKNELVESTMSYLIAVNTKDSTVLANLNKVKDTVGIDSMIEAELLDPKSMAKLAGFITSASVSVSQSVGSGASQVISF